jgi:hypothetical protein
MRFQEVMRLQQAMELSGNEGAGAYRVTGFMRLWFRGYRVTGFMRLWFRGYGVTKLQGPIGLRCLFNDSTMALRFWL